jgi:hypothetical protein
MEEKLESTENQSLDKKVDIGKFSTIQTFQFAEWIGEN